MHRGQPTRHETRGEIEAAAYGHIVVLGDQIYGPVVEVPLWPDSRILCQEGWQQGQNMRAANRWRHADLQDTCWLAVVGHCLSNGNLKRIEIAVDRNQEPLASFRERQLAGRSLKQPDPEVAFQHRDVSADRGSSQSQPASCF
jgi:hypothetical protein